MKKQHTFVLLGLLVFLFATLADAAVIDRFAYKQKCVTVRNIDPLDTGFLQKAVRTCAELNPRNALCQNHCREAAIYELSLRRRTDLKRLSGTRGQSGAEKCSLLTQKELVPGSVCKVPLLTACEARNKGVTCQQVCKRNAQVLCGRLGGFRH